ALRQMLLLSEHSGERGARGFLRVPARLHLDRKLVSDLTMLLGTGPRLGNHRLMMVALRFELLPHAAKLVHDARRLLAPGDALRELGVEPLSLGRKLRDRVIENARAAAQLLELAPRRLELRLRLGVALLLQVRVLLRLLPRVLELLDSLSRLHERSGNVFDLGGGRLRLPLQAGNLFAAGDDTDLRVVAPVDSQPVPTNPRAVRRDDRFAVRELGTKPNGLLERRHGSDSGEERLRRRRALDEVREPLLAVVLRIPAVAGLLEQREPALGQLGEALGDVVECRDTHGLQIAAEHGLDGALPARLDREALRQAAPADDGRTLEPFADLLRRLAQRGLLQRLERRETASVVLQLRTQPVEVLGGLLLLLSKLLDLLPDGVEQACGLGALGLQRLLLRRQLIEPRLELLEAKRVAFRRLPLLLARKAISLRGELLEPRFLDLRGALHV